MGYVLWVRVDYVLGLWLRLGLRVGSRARV